MSPDLWGTRQSPSSSPPVGQPTRRPRWDLMRAAVGAMLLCYVWRVQDLVPLLGKLKVPVLVSAGAIGLFLLSTGAMRVLGRLRHPLIKLAVLILLLMVLSVPTSLYQGMSVSFLLNDFLKTFMMMLLIVTTARGFVDLERYAAVQVIGGVVYCLFVLTRFKVDASGRLGSLEYYDANDLAMLLVGTVPLILYFLRRGAPKRMRLAALVAMGTYLVTIERTGSRGGFLGLIAVALFLLLTFRALPARVRLGSVVGAALILGVVASDRYWNMMQTLLHIREDYNWSGHADEGRMEVWKRGLGYMWQRPLTGVGVQAFTTAEGTISPIAQRQDYGVGVKWSAAHNALVQIGAELGVPGLLAFVALIVVAFRTMGRVSRHRPDDTPERRSEAAMAQALRACLVGYCVTAFFLSQAYAAYLYSLLGLVTAVSVLSRVRRDGPTAMPGWRTPTGIHG